MDILSGVVILFLITLLVFLLTMIWPPDSPWSPWWRTNNKTARALCKVAKISEKDYLIDLGCGDGEVLVTAAAMYKASGIGVEIDPLRVFIARLRVMVKGVSSRVIIVRGNLFETDFTPATVVIVYLVPKTLKRLEPLFRSQLKPGTRVVSYMYQIPYLSLKAKDAENKLFVYEIRKTT